MLNECRLFGFISAEEYERAIQLKPFQSLTPAATRKALVQPPGSTTTSTAGVPASDAHKGHLAAASYLARLVSDSRRLRGRALDAIAAGLTDGRCTDAFQFDWSTVDYHQTSVVRAAIDNGQFAPGTASNYLGAMRGVLKECWRLGYINIDVYRRATDIEPSRGPRQASRTLRRSSRHPTVAIRDAVVPAVYRAGIRQREAVALDLSDYDRLGGPVRVRGNMNMERLVPLDPCGRAAVDAWVQIRGSAPGPLFCSLLRLGQPRPMSRSAAHEARQRLAAPAIS